MKIENPKTAMRKRLELIIDWEIAGYKMHTQKSISFLYTNYKSSERETKEIISFTISPSTKTQPHIIAKGSSCGKPKPMRKQDANKAT